MKTKRLLLILLLLLPFTALLQAQTQKASVEKSMYGVQAGLLGVWAHNESKLSNTIVLRTELGLDGNIWNHYYYDNAAFLLVPALTVEPRWYYNLSKRLDKSKRIDGNSGNFVSLKITHHPDWFVIGDPKSSDLISDISFRTMWGIRRNIGNHFNYEAITGLSYYYALDEEVTYNDDAVVIFFTFSFKVGYRF
ncbi:hypothetical protein DN752_03595 [Echinicola strongylocentroti]|uniref:DUF3575 domain-containing protein n=1 Tax=Echinicola strongylocentroti TaxID=1795355 RepID=A0A2Z4IFM7_9BACT|nr:hypothetical protein [Echinicola strongylocentroti]AWW29298.1 hypothetical protein DN752_03595 [Echinicola strongylocentroti]